MDAGTGKEFAIQHSIQRGQEIPVGFRFKGMLLIIFVFVFCNDVGYPE